MKRALSFLLVAALMLPQVAFASFNDTADSPYADAIQWMSRNQVVEGYANGEFGPDTCTTRVEFLTMLYKTLEVDLYSISPDSFDNDMPDFSDVEEGKWFHPVVEHAVLSGAASGYPDGSFRPHKCVRNGEAIKMAVHEFNGGVVPLATGPVDVYGLDEDAWYFETVHYALSTNQVGDVEEDFFPVEAEMTREQVAEMLYRMKTVRDHKLEAYTWFYQPFPLEKELFFNQCVTPNYDVRERLRVDTVLPPDSDIVFGVNRNQNQEIRDMERVLDAFVSDEMWAELIAAYESQGVPNQLTYEAGVRPFLLDDWELAFSMVVPEDAEDLDTWDEDYEAYLIGSFEDYTAFEEFAGRWMHMHYDGEIECSRPDDFVYWTNEDDDFYLAHGDGLFVVTNTAENREKAVERAENRETYMPVDGVQTAYGFVSGDVVDLFMEEFEAETGMGYGLMSGELGDLTFELNAQTNGLRFESSVELSEDSTLASLYVGDVQFDEVVNAENLALYLEGQDFLGIMDSQFASMGMSMYDALSTLLNEESKMEETAFNELLANPFAFTVKTGGSLIPSANLYLDFGSEDDENVAALDAMMTELSETLSTLLLGEVSEWTADKTGRSLMSFDLDGTELEWSFGLVDGETYVLSTETDFVETWGDDVLADSADFESALEHLSEVGANLSYWDPSAVMDWLAMLPTMDSELLEMVDEVVSNIGSGVSSSWMEDGVVYSEAFVEIR